MYVRDVAIGGEEVGKKKPSKVVDIWSVLNFIQ